MEDIRETIDYLNYYADKPKVYRQQVHRKLPDDIVVCL